MFWPRLRRALRQAAIVSALLTDSATAALAQTIGYGAPSDIIVHAAKTYHKRPAVSGRALALLAAVSAEAGIPFMAKPKTKKIALPLIHPVADAEPALCIKAGVSMNPAVMAGPPMILEHGVLGCPTNTAGLPVVLMRDPMLPPPPNSRTGQYDVNLMMRYRLMERDRVTVIASLTEQGLGYSLGSPISGNNFLAALTMMF